MKSRVINNLQSKAVLFCIDDDKCMIISEALRNIGLTIIIPDRIEYGHRIDFLAGLDNSSPDVQKNCIFEESELILFSDITSKQLDNALTALKKNNVSVRFKAVITPYNRKFYLSELYEHMYEEEKQFKK